MSDGILPAVRLVELSQKLQRQHAWSDDHDLQAAGRGASRQRVVSLAAHMPF